MRGHLPCESYHKSEPVVVIWKPCAECPGEVVLGENAARKITHHLLYLLVSHADEVW